MMKPGIMVLVVDTMDEAIKFYTEKLAFDIADIQVGPENDRQVSSVLLRKGKCFLIIRVPTVEELAEFSFIKRCASRCVGSAVEIKKGLEKYFERCKKKGVKISQELKEESGEKSFSVRDPFGLKLVFYSVEDNKKRLFNIKREEAQSIDAVIERLRDVGISRRVSKKFAKQVVKSKK
jgi:uncharacterized glyoxalase superfamily protein PhnB